MSEPAQQPENMQPQSQFPYRQFFRTIDLLADLQAPKQERPWLDRVPEEVEEKEYLLYLGCNVLRTPALIQTAAAVLTRMGVDFAAVGGPANCCGIIHYGQGDRPIATSISSRTLGKLRSFRARQVLLWCPSCTHHFQEVLEGTVEIGFLYLHLTQFLSENLHRLRFDREVPLRVALHHHTGFAQSDLDAACTKKILAAIPGLRLVEVRNRRELGKSCLPGQRPDPYGGKWRELIGGILEEAREKGVDVLATVYHSCQRELCAEERTYPFKVENYIQLVGRALGIEHDDLYKSYLLLGDEGRVFEQARPTIEANSLDPEEARDVIRRTFQR
ncbi:MAG: (Fe-S)-binding protein [Candidatus Tectomicrobia bacterium]|nr:(Fe-S)-binding protein [Candidatus Tectomicrobia bacterium]